MRDRWTELCEQAATELDHHKFRAILRELNQLLDEHGAPPARHVLHSSAEQRPEFPTRAEEQTI